MAYMKSALNSGPETYTPQSSTTAWEIFIFSLCSFWPLSPPHLTRKWDVLLCWTRVVTRNEQPTTYPNYWQRLCAGALNLRLCKGKFTSLQGRLRLCTYVFLCRVYWMQGLSKGDKRLWNVVWNVVRTPQIDHNNEPWRPLLSRPTAMQIVSLETK